MARVRVLNHGGELWLNIDEAVAEIQRDRELAKQTLGFLLVWKDSPEPKHEIDFVMQMMAANYLAHLAGIELPHTKPPASGA